MLDSLRGDLWALIAGAESFQGTLGDLWPVCVPPIEDIRVVIMGTERIEVLLDLSVARLHFSKVTTVISHNVGVSA